ncbi:MAG: ClpXP protease specificity-enhancing factor [Burkholderiales bacterium]|nr:ClpXP protease specificity-enhancing factor [Burkholderiales bacterium]
MISQKSYLIRAIYEWCVDNSLTPFLATQVDEKTTVPNQYVQHGRIVLNLSPSASKDLQIDYEWITFRATFGGILSEVSIPVSNVISIFAQESGQGMQFNIEVKTKNDDIKKPHSGLRLVK